MSSRSRVNVTSKKKQKKRTIIALSASTEPLPDRSLCLRQSTGIRSPPSTRTAFSGSFCRRRKKPKLNRSKSRQHKTVAAGLEENDATGNRIEAGGGTARALAFCFFVRTSHEAAVNFVKMIPIE